MPKRKRDYTVKHSDDMVQLAVGLLRDKKISSYDAEKRFGIPRRTLLDKLHEKHPKTVGGPTRLSEEDEQKFVNVIIAAGDFGSPLSLLDLKLVVHRYLQNSGRESVFNGKPPGDKWVRLFLQRHNHQLTHRQIQNIKRARAAKTCNEIKAYFENLQITLNGVPRENILNYDETNLSDNPGAKKCLFRRGVKYPERVMNSTKGSISIMFAITAGCERLPPYVVYKAENLFEEWRLHGPKGTRYNRTKSGWFDTAMFEDWFSTIILPWARSKDGPKLLIGDNLASHINVKIVELCEENNIKFVFLPPNSSHITQPLDVSYFGPMKKQWRAILLNYKNKNRGQSSLNKCHFPELLKTLIDAVDSKPDNIKSAFKATGIYPLNPEMVLKRLPDFKPDQSYKIEHALLDYLKENRSPNVDQPEKKPRNKKVNVPPGVSVSASDFNYQVKLDVRIGKSLPSKELTAESDLRNVIVTSNILLTPQKTTQDGVEPKAGTSWQDRNIGSSPEKTINRRRAKNKFSIYGNSSSEDESIERYSLLDPSDNESWFIPSELEPEPDYPEEEIVETMQKNTIEVSVNQFVLVKFSTEKSTRYFIGKVLAKLSVSCFKIKFLRHRGKGIFIWPPVEDVSTMYTTDLEMVVPNPKEERRGALRFDISSMKTYAIG